LPSSFEKKRLIEHHLKKIVETWSQGARITRSDREATDIAKAEWEAFCRQKIGISNYSLPDKAYKIHLTGDQADKFLKCGHQGIAFLDQDPKTLQLWNIMKEIVRILRLQRTKEQNLTDLNKLCSNYLELYTSRYSGKTVTPYIHIVLAHAEEIQRENLKNGILIYHYTGEAMEAANNGMQKEYHRSTNHEEEVEGSKLIQKPCRCLIQIKGENITIKDGQTNYSQRN
jgi:hypothetical protein